VILLGVALILVATLLNEVENVVDKKQFAKHHLTHYTVGFLTTFWSFLFFVGIQYFGSGFEFSTDSLPTLIPRIILEILLGTLAIRGMLAANLSTTSLVRLLTIPGLLLVDYLVGYELQSSQLLGMILIFVAMLILTVNNKIKKDGIGLLTLGALIAVATTSLFKYNIENFNSVATEQSIVLFAYLFYFGLQMMRNAEYPIKTLRKVWAEEISLFAGFATVLNSFALSLLPPSLMLTFKRSGSMGWSLVLGQKVFHEHHIIRKIIAASVALCGVVLIAI
jgi:hypothetical protein